MLREILSGGMKLAVGLVVSAAVLAVPIWLYNEREDEKHRTAQAKAEARSVELQRIKHWPDFALDGYIFRLSTRWERGNYDGDGKIAYLARIVGKEPLSEATYGFSILDADGMMVWCGIFEGEDFLIRDQTNPNEGWFNEGKDAIGLSEYSSAARFRVISSTLPTGPRREAANMPLE